MPPYPAPVGNTVKASRKGTVRPWEPGQHLRLRSHRSLEMGSWVVNSGCFDLMQGHSPCMPVVPCDPIKPGAGDVWVVGRQPPGHPVSHRRPPGCLESMNHGVSWDLSTSPNTSSPPPLPGRHHPLEASLSSVACVSFLHEQRVPSLTPPPLPLPSSLLHSQASPPPSQLPGPLPAGLPGASPAMAPANRPGGQGSQLPGPGSFSG